MGTSPINDRSKALEAATRVLKDPEKTIVALENAQFSNSFAQATFNRHVEAVYWKDTAAHKDARRALLITDKDLILQRIEKQMIFFFSLQNFTQQTEEKISFAKGTAEGDPNMVRLKVQLSPSLLYKKDGTSVGKRYISVPHIDESKLGEFRNFRMVHGMIIRIYAFADKKQIKVLVKDEAEGDRVINELLRIIIPKWRLGTSEEHSYTGKPPKDVKDYDLVGITSKCHQLHVFHPHERPYTFYV
jgi:hypothetical protein